MPPTVVSLTPEAVESRRPWAAPRIVDELPAGVLTMKSADFNIVEYHSGGTAQVS